MAYRYIDSDTTLEQFFIDNDDYDPESDIIRIRYGSVLSIEESNSRLIGEIFVTDGKISIIPLDNKLLHFKGKDLENLRLYANGELFARGDMLEVGVTDGTDNQIITVGGDSESYFGEDFIDVISGIWVETYRKIYFDSENILIERPKPDDWLYESGNDKTLGQLYEVGDDYIIVKLLTRTTSSGTSLEVRKVIDSNGPIYEKIWTCITNLDDEYYPGLLMPFGNSSGNQEDKLDRASTEIGGNVFTHIFQSNSLVLGSTSGGYKPPSGCKIFIPNIHFSTCSMDSFDMNQTYWDGTNTETNRYELLTTYTGSVDLEKVSLGSVFFCSTLADKFKANYVSANVEFGVSACNSQALYNQCIVSGDLLGQAVSTRYLIRIMDNPYGAIVTESQVVLNQDSVSMYIGAETSDNIIYKNNTFISLGTAGYLTRIYKCRHIDYINNIVVSREENTMGSLLYFITSFDINIESPQISHTRDFTKISFNQSTITFSSFCDKIIIKGFTYLGGGISKYLTFNISDSFNLKIRAIGTIDHKLLLDEELYEFIYCSGVSENINVARVWVSKTKYNRFMKSTPTVKNVSAVNSGNDYSGNTNQIFTNKVLRYSGCQSCSGEIGSTTGLETDLQSVYGVHWLDYFRSDISGAISIIFSPKTEETNHVYSILEGSPNFTNDGDLHLKQYDSIEYETPNWIIGHETFNGEFTTSRSGGTVADGTDEWGTAVDKEFQYDIGSGYNGTWLEISETNLTDIPDFRDGIKLKIRFTANSDRDYLNAFSLNTNTTLDTQKSSFYPIDQEQYSFKLTGLIPGTEVRIYNEDLSEELFGVEESNEFIEFLHKEEFFNTVIVIHKENYEYIRYEGIDIPKLPMTIPIKQRFDRNYKN